VGDWGAVARCFLPPGLVPSLGMDQIVAFQAVDLHLYFTMTFPDPHRLVSRVHPEASGQKPKDRFIFAGGVWGGPDVCSMTPGLKESFRFKFF